MKPIVIYYSLTGKTKAVAEGFAKGLGCDINQIEEVKKRSIPGAYFLGAFAAMRGKASDIKPLNVNIDVYDTLIIATPVWASSPVPAINALIASINLKGKKVVLLISPASGDDSKAAALLTDRIHAKGGVILQHHAFKTSGHTAEELGEQAAELSSIYK